MLHKIVFEIDADAGRLAGFTDEHILNLWHVAQANPAPHGDAAAGALVRSLGDEIVRRWLGSVPVPMYLHQMGGAAGADAGGRVVAGGSGGGAVEQSGAAAVSPEIGSAFAGGIYAGIASNTDGAYRLVLINGDQGDLDWDAAQAWAASVGGQLPNRVEQALLYANLKDQFKGAGYWSSEPAGSSTAWFQNFSYGLQRYNDRSFEGRARAVRRLPI